MSEQKTIVISVRLSPAVHAALTARASVDRQPVTRMAALLVEDGLKRQAVASVVPVSASLQSGQERPQVQPFFRQPAKKKGRRA